MPEQTTHAEWLKLKQLSTKDLNELATIIEAILTDRMAEDSGHKEYELEHWENI